MRPATSSPFDAPAKFSRIWSAAFTLTELLVTIAIVAILIALLTSGFKGVRAAAWSAKCSSNLHQLATACAAYSTERRVLPHPGQGSLVVLLDMPAEVWVCPANDGIDGVPIPSYLYPATPLWFREDGRAWRWEWVSRAYEQNQRIPLIEDMAMFHGHRNVAGFDGGVTRQFEGGLETIAVGP